MIVKTFKDQFAPLVREGIKNQTVRPVPKRPQDIPKAGDVISLRRWTGKPYRSKQEVLRESIVTAVQPVRIHEGGAGSRCHPWSEWIDWAHVEDLNDFAKADGFASFEEMRAWFTEQHGLPFEGMTTYWATPGQIAQLQKLRDEPDKLWWVKMNSPEWDDVITLKNAGLIENAGGDLKKLLAYHCTVRGALRITELNVRGAL
jgi:hypothetical protein